MLSTKQTIINFQVVSQLKRERVSKPSSVLAAIYLRPTVTSRLKRPTRRVKPRAELTGIFGLAGGGVCPAGAVTDTAVRSYRTISPLPVPPCFLAKARRGPSAVYFLWHYPAGCPGWLLTTTVPFPARTFLPRRFASPAAPTCVGRRRGRQKRSSGGDRPTHSFQLTIDYYNRSSFYFPVF